MLCDFSAGHRIYHLIYLLSYKYSCKVTVRNYNCTCNVMSNELYMREYA